MQGNAVAGMSGRLSGSRTGLLVCLTLLGPVAGGPARGGASQEPPERGAIVIAPKAYPEYVNRWALIVGISKYKWPSLTLNYAHRDAEALSEILQTPSGGAFDKDHIRLLVNEQATTAAIRDALRTYLKKPAREDVVFVYFAAHGAPDPDRPNNIYLITYDTDPANISGTAVPMNEVQTAFKDTLLAERVVLLADTCHSAAVGGASGRVTTDNAAIMNLYLQQLSESKSGIAFMSSAEKGEVAREDEKWGGGHGVFTHYLLEGMRGAADTAPKDGVVSVGELFEWVREQVKDATDGKQHPSIGQQGFDRNLPVAITGGITAHELYRLGRGLFDLAIELDDMSRLRSAADQLREAIRLARGSGSRLREAEVLLGRALVLLGEYDQAVGTLRAAAQAAGQPGAEASLLLGIALAERGDHAEAARILSGYAERDPKAEDAPWARSFATSLEETAGRQGLPARKRALLIGIGNYRDPTMVSRLAGPENDVSVARDYLVNIFGFSPDDITVLLDEAATRDAVHGAFDRLSKETVPGDAVYVHWSGHSFHGGISTEPYLIPYDFARDNRHAGITPNELHDLISRIPTSNTFVVLDTHTNEAFIDLARASGGYHALLGDKNALEISFESRPFGVLTHQLLQTLTRPHPKPTTYGELVMALTQGMNAVSLSQPQTPSLVGDLDSVLLGGESPFTRSFKDAHRRTWRALDPDALVAVAGRPRTDATFPAAHRDLCRTLLDHGRFADANPCYRANRGESVADRLAAEVAAAGSGEPQALRRIEEMVSAEAMEPWRTDLLKRTAELAKADKRAFLVGISDYQSPEVTDVPAARDDLAAVKRALMGHFGLSPENIKVLADTEASRGQILKAFHELVSAGGASLFYFSGAGSGTKEGGFSVVPADGRQAGVRDIDLGELAGEARKGPGSLLSVFDCGWGGAPRSAAPDERPRGERGVGMDWSYTGFPTVGRASIVSAGWTGGLRDGQFVRTLTPPDFTGGFVAALGAVKQASTPSLTSGRVAALMGAQVEGEQSYPFFEPSAALTGLWLSARRSLAESGLQEAVAVLERSIEKRGGTYPEGLLNLGVAYAALGEIEKSVQALESAILQGTGDLRTEARYHLGRILYENRKNLPRAVDELRQVAQLEPGSVRTPFYLGQAIRAMVEIDLLQEAEGALRSYVAAGAPFGNRREVQAFLDERGKRAEPLTR